MRALLLALFSAIVVFAQDPQAVPSPAQGPDNLSIPARLSKTVDTNKCKAGDEVEMRTVEPVLIANGLVMPENAKLHGKIVASASRQNDKPSWLLLVIERAEWKKNSIALRAFVAAQITITTQVRGQNDKSFQGAIDLPDVERRRHGGARAQSNPGGDISSSMGHLSRDATVEENDSQQLSYHRLDDLRILKDKNGRVFLLSEKPHLKLPSGTLFMLHNQPVVVQEQAAVKASNNTR